MVELPYWAFIAYTQGMIFSLLGMVIFFMLFRKHKRLAVAAQAGLKDELSFNKIKLYFDMEVKVTRGQNERLQQKEELSLDEKIETSLLNLRADLLEFESEYSDKDVAAPDYWNALLEHYRSTLKRHDLLGRFETVHNEELDDVQSIVSSQEKEMSGLLEDIDNMELSEEQIKQLKEKLFKLANSHKELSACVFTLEDENRFLREQIAALLKEING